MRDHEHYLFYTHNIIRCCDYGTGEGLTLTLDRGESNHALSVLRIKVGQPIRLADGYGYIYNCQCAEISKRFVSCTVINMRYISKIIPEVTLLIGLPDKEHFETIIEQATALGVSRIIPIAADHCRKPWWDRWDGLRQRFISKMIVSMKQCLYPYLPTLDAPTPLREAVAECVGMLIVADQQGKPLNDADILPHKKISCLIGPPGGLSAAESNFLETYAAIPITSVKIAPTRLRSELAAAVLCSRVIGAHL